MRHLRQWVQVKARKPASECFLHFPSMCAWTPSRFHPGKAIPFSVLSSARLHVSRGLEFTVSCALWEHLHKLYRTTFNVPSQNLGVQPVNMSLVVQSSKVACCIILRRWRRWPINDWCTDSLPTSRSHAAADSLASGRPVASCNGGLVEVGGFRAIESLEPREEVRLGPWLIYVYMALYSWPFIIGIIMVHPRNPTNWPTVEVSSPGPTRIRCHWSTTKICMKQWGKI